ncbi:MAG: mannonate dehydratase [Streptococcaceae bacterium]|jgi:mannonate dehydratase|nr:mannonate dehydratase [Streptococcaceae bacterium]
MKMTMRWFGSEQDHVKLKDIRQVPGMSGVVGALYDVPVGDVWPEEKIKALMDEVHEAGLEMEVIESVNIHDDIKIGLPSRDQYIENYKETIRNLGKFGVKVICYNFMPIFDWLKTDLHFELPDGSFTMKYEKAGIEKSPQEMVDSVLNNSNGVILPGWEPERLATVMELFEAYSEVDEAKLRDNFKYFMEGIMPALKETGIKMAIHPDDPPYSVFGLPRIVKNREDLDWLMTAVDEPENGITFCTGSIGEDPKNDVVAIVGEFAKRGRIPFAHVRNIKFLNETDHFEAPHLSEMGSLDMHAVVKALYDNGFDGYIRPDHGRMIWGEEGRPGYGLYDRAIGASYLLGLWEAIKKG